MGRLMQKIRPSSYKWRLLVGAAAAGIIAPGLASAQDGEPETASAESGDVITVTGSRIRGVAPVGSPLIQLDRGEIEQSSAVTTDRLIRELPQVFDLGVSENSRGQAGGNSNITYGNSVNLRGIGPYATLILVNGHRAVTNTRSLDPSVMPTLALERVEVVADGASAIYGSDAIAGVVNLIPRTSFDGFEVLGRYSVADDFDEYQVGGVFGKTFDRGRVMIAYEHVERSNLSGDDRSFFTADQRDQGGRDFRVNQCAPGTIIVDGVTYAIPEGGVTPANAGSLTPDTANLCSSQQGQDLFPETSYDSVYGNYAFDITDNLTFFGDGYFSHRDFRRYGAYPNTTLTVPDTNAFFVDPSGSGATSVQVGYNFMNDFPKSQTAGGTESWQAVNGLRLALPNDWQAEVSVGYGKSDDTSNSYDGINNAALNAALASSDPATAFDPFGLNRTSQAVLDGINNQIFLAPTLNELLLYTANLDGPIFNIGGNQARLAVGFERQEIDSSLGSARGAPTNQVVFRDFSRNVNSGYAELFLPVVGGANASQGLERLELTAAVRYDDYSDVGDTLNPKFGIVYAPTGSISFRGSYGTSFRAPLFGSIYGNSNAMFVQRYLDPTSPTGTTVGLARSGPNLDLAPEEATTWTAGADWSPTENLTFALTYFNVKYEGQVNAYLSDLAILGREAAFEGTGLILRGQAAADQVQEFLDQGIPILGAPPSPITLFVDGRNYNLGVSKTAGFDFQAGYGFETQSLGSFDFNLNGTWLTKYEVAITDQAELVDRLDTLFNPLDFKARASATWRYGASTARVQVTYVGGYENDFVTPVQQVDAYKPIDLSWRYDLSDVGGLANGLTLGVDVRNIFDEDPPYVNIAPSGNGSGGYDATTTNPVGRTFSFSLNKRF